MQIFLNPVAIEQTFSRSPDDEINVVIGDGDDHIGHIVWSVQMAFHGGPEGDK